MGVLKRLTVSDIFSRILQMEVLWKYDSYQISVKYMKVVKTVEKEIKSNKAKSQNVHAPGTQVLCCFCLGNMLKTRVNWTQGIH